jgi:hypothetical protein
MNWRWFYDRYRIPHGYFRCVKAGRRPKTNTDDVAVVDDATDEGVVERIRRVSSTGFGILAVVVVVLVIVAVRDCALEGVPLSFCVFPRPQPSLSSDADKRQGRWPKLVHRWCDVGDWSCHPIDSSLAGELAKRC